MKASKNIKNIYISSGRCLLIVIALLGIGLSSCKKYLDIDPPSDRLVNSNVFNDNSTATGALLNIYAKMNNSIYPYYIPYFTGLSSDELENYATKQESIDLYRNALNSVTSPGNNLWTAAYSYIYMANAVLEGLDKSTGVTQAVKQQITGEAKFSRAFWHFYLVNFFGDVPLVTTTSYQINTNLSRTPKNLVYTQIIDDLKTALDLVNGDYVKADNSIYTISSAERIRPNKYAIAAFLARVYLYNKDWVNAEAQASYVITNTSFYSLSADLNDVFKKNSTESIWQLQPVIGGSYNTYEGFYFKLTGAPSTTDYLNSSGISTQLLNAFETNDKRKQKWIDSVELGTKTYYFPNKYKVGASSTVSEYSSVFRLAEQFLIRAEARAQQNKISEGLQDVNKIRNRAGLMDTTTTSKDQLVDIILHERQVELFTEWGHRWFDLKRTDKVNTVMSQVTPLKGGSWNSNAQFFPIPQSERNLNSNLTQNPGY